MYNFLMLLFLLFLGLKLSGVIAWAWIWVFLPFLIPFVVFGSFLLTVFLLACGGCKIEAKTIG